MNGISLRKRPFSWRTLKSRTFSVVAGAMTFAAVLPLAFILFTVVKNGGERLLLDDGAVSLSQARAVLTEKPPAPGREGGGLGSAIVGTLIMTAVASALAIPLGILAAIHLNEYVPQSRFAAAVRFAAKTMTGLPSILAGVFAFAVVVERVGFSALAGGVALSLLMVPVVLLTAEEALRQVPQKTRDAAYGLGATRAQTILKVVLPASWGSVITGVMLGLARAAGETAPLLFTAKFSRYFEYTLVGEWMGSLSVLIYNFSGYPDANSKSLAWAASLVLVLVVLTLNVAARLATARRV